MYDKRKMQDIKYSELPLLNEYQEYYANRNINGINNLTSNELKYKVFNAYNWNRILDLINDSTRYPEWSGFKTYKTGNYVTYKNKIYMATRDFAFIPPSNANYWELINQPVNQNNQLLTTDSIIGKWQDLYNQLETATTNFIYKGNWSSGVSYKKNNLVKLDNYRSYYCIENHTSSSSNQPPNATYWVMAKSNPINIPGIPISQTQPQNISENDIWFQEIQ